MLVLDKKTLIDMCDVHLHMDFDSLCRSLKIVDIALLYLRKAAMTKSVDYDFACHMKKALLELYEDYTKSYNS